MGHYTRLEGIYYVFASIIAVKPSSSGPYQDAWGNRTLGVNLSTAILNAMADRPLVKHPARCKYILCMAEPPLVSLNQPGR
jgi:hypothetical protein